MTKTPLTCSSHIEHIVLCYFPATLQLHNCKPIVLESCSNAQKMRVF